MSTALRTLWSGLRSDSTALRPYQRPFLIGMGIGMLLGLALFAQLIVTPTEQKDTGALSPQTPHAAEAVQARLLAR